MIASPKTCSAWLNDAMRALGELGIKAEELSSITVYRSIPTVMVPLEVLRRVCRGRRAEVNPNPDGELYTVRFDAVNVQAFEYTPRDLAPRSTVIGDCDSLPINRHGGVAVNVLEQPSVAHSPNDANSV